MGLTDPLPCRLAEEACTPNRSSPPRRQDRKARNSLRSSAHPTATRRLPSRRRLGAPYQAPSNQSVRYRAQRSIFTFRTRRRKLGRPQQANRDCRPDPQQTCLFETSRTTHRRQLRSRPDVRDAEKGSVGIQQGRERSERSSSGRGGGGGGGGFNSIGGTRGACSREGRLYRRSWRRGQRQGACAYRCKTGQGRIGQGFQLFRAAETCRCKTGR